MPAPPSLPEPGGSPPGRSPVVRAVCPFEARQTWAVNRRFPQSGWGVRWAQREHDIKAAFTTEPTSGWGAGSSFGS